MRLEGKRALITGAGTNVSAAIAARLEAEGARVVCAEGYIDGADYCSAAMERALSELGGLDILVNCTPVYGEWLSLENTDDSVYDYAVMTSQTGVFLMCREAFRVFSEQKSGVCVNVCSIAAAGGAEGTAFEMAQSAMLGLTRNIAMQYAGDGSMRCCAVCITPPAPHPLSDDGEYIMSVVKYGKRHIKPQTDEDTANAVAWLVSDEGRQVTGQYILVDGGFFVRDL